MQKHIHTYIQFQEQIDQFYKDMYHSEKTLNKQRIIDLFMLANIKLNSLETAHKNREFEKHEKIKSIS